MKTDVRGEKEGSNGEGKEKEVWVRRMGVEGTERMWKRKWKSPGQREREGRNDNLGSLKRIKCYESHTLVNSTLLLNANEIGKDGVELLPLASGCEV